MSKKRRRNKEREAEIKAKIKNVDENSHTEIGQSPNKTNG